MSWFHRRSKQEEIIEKHHKRLQKVGDTPLTFSKRALLGYAAFFAVVLVISFWGQSPIGPQLALNTPSKARIVSNIDFDYIKKEGMDIIEVASYLDGNYSCFPFVEVFDCFSKEIVQKSYLDVLHTAMFANIKDSDMYYGTWFLLVGNVPAFLERYGIEIDWKKLYAVFDRFLDISLIKSPSVKNNYYQLIC